MELANIHGKMEEVTMENINKIKNMAMEYIYGQMEEDMKVFGIMESSMDEENIFNKMV